MKSFIAAFFSLCVFFGSTHACTGIVLKSKEGIAITGRTLDFSKEIHSSLIAIPKGYRYVGTTPGGKGGAEWESKYNIVGMSALGYPQFVEGLNERGLAVGVFYFSGYAGYSDFDPSHKEDYLASWEYGTWLLSNFATVEEVKENAGKVKIAKTALPEWGEIIPLHYFVRDAEGNNLTLEYIDGTLHVHDNPIGILTNSPDFPWHIVNLQNYVNLSAVNVPQVKLSGLTVGAEGSGSGLLGLPGDFTPPSRFIRATAFTQTALPVEQAENGATQAFHILNSFDIPKGTVYRPTPDGKDQYNYTQWISATDMGNKKFYYHTHGDRRVRMVDLKKLSFEDGKMKTFAISSDQDIEDVTGRLHSTDSK
jgi:choloylglycine hydrolase